MGPWSFPIVAEARMAERLLEAERARLARTAAAGQGSQGSARAGDPQPSRGTGLVSRRRRLVTIGVTLVACLVLGGAVMVGDQAAVASVVPVRPTFRSVMSPALVSGEWLCLSNGYCEVRLDEPRVSDRGPAFDPAASSLGDGPLTGTFSLHGPDGAWAGPVAATWDESSRWQRGLQRRRPGVRQGGCLRPAGDRGVRGLGVRQSLVGPDERRAGPGGRGHLPGTRSRPRRAAATSSSTCGHRGRGVRRDRRSGVAAASATAGSGSSS